VWEIPLAPPEVTEYQVHVDETRWREGSRTPWLWVAVGTMATLFLIQLGRGKTQLQALRGGGNNG
jgi:hypothetical protein